MQNSNLFKEMKTLARTLYQLVDKSSQGIHLKSMHDCAQVISKLYGFSSWNEFKQTIPKLKQDNFHDLKTFDNINSPDFVFLKVKKSQFKINVQSHDIISEPEIIEKNLISEIIIGRKYNPVLKSHKMISLLPENFIIFSGLSEKKSLNSIKRQFKEFGHNYINLTEQIGSKHLKLDPWTYLFKNEGLENFFYSQDSSEDFILSWISVLRYIQHEFNFTPSSKEALDFLTIPGIIHLYDWLKENKQSSAWYFQRYFEKIGVVENNDHYDISIQTQQKHWGHIKKSYNLLHNLNSLYEEKIFQKSSTDQLWNYLITGKSIHIGLLPSSVKNDFYKKIVLKEIIRVINQYKKKIGDKLPQHYTIGLFCENMELWNHSLFNQLQEDFLLKGFVSSSGKGLKDISCENINQVVFLKSFNLEIPFEIKEKILDETRILEENIFYSQMNILKNIDENTGFLWSYQPQTDVPREFWAFQIEKYQVYDTLD